MTPSYVWCDLFICETWLMHICVTWLISMCDMTHSYVWHATNGGDRTWNKYDCENIQRVSTGVPVYINHIFMGIPNLHTIFHVCNRSPRYFNYLWGKPDRFRDPNILSLISPGSGDMPPSYMLHDSIICVTWLIHVCHMTYFYIWHDSFIRVANLFLYVTWFVHMCDVTHF